MTHRTTSIALLTLLALATPAAAREPIVITDFENPLSDIISAEQREMVLECRITLLTAGFATPPKSEREISSCTSLVDGYDQLNDALKILLKDN